MRLLAANLAALLATSLWGASVVATRVVVQSVPPLTLAAMRFGQGTLVLLLVLLLFAPALLRIKRQDVGAIALAGFVIFTCFSILFNLSLSLTEAARGALMLATAPLWSVLIGRTLTGERLAPRQIIGIGLSIIGIAVSLLERGLSFGAGDLSMYLGDALMLLAALCVAIYGVLARRILQTYAAITVTAYAMLFGTLLLLVPLLVLEDVGGALVALDQQTLLLLVFLGVLGGALAHFLWVQSLSALAATQVAVYINLNPLVAAILGAWLLREQISLLFILGFSLVLSGVLLVNWPHAHRLHRT